MAFSSVATIPKIGFGLGTAWFRGYTHNVDGSPIIGSIVTNTRMALDAGCRHLDLAEVYGNDREFAIAYQQFLKSNPDVSRGDFWITSKLMNNIQNPIEGCRAMLDRLGCDYLDLLLIHCPIPFARAKADPSQIIPDISVIWPQLEQLVDDGLVRNIGVSNFRVEDLQELMSVCRIPPALNQIEFNPYLQQPALNSFCFEHGIQLAAYSPLGTLNLWPGGPCDKVVDELSRKYSVSTSHILLKYTIQKGFVPITTSSKRERIADYLSVLTSPVELTPEEVKSIDDSGADVMKRKYWADLF